MVDNAVDNSNGGFAGLMQGDNFIVYEKDPSNLVSMAEITSNIQLQADDQEDEFTLKAMVDFRPASLAHQMRFVQWNVKPKIFTPRYALSATPLAGGTSVLFFGGATEDAYFVPQNVQVFDGDKKEWRNISVRGQAPPRRIGHTATLDSSMNRIIIIGGTTSNGESLNTVDILHGVRDLNDCSWNSLHAGQWRLPDGESDIQAQYNRQDWCGCDPSQYPRENWTNTDKRKISGFHNSHWKRYRFTDNSESFPCLSHHSCVLSGQCLYVFGGIRSRSGFSSDIWRLNMNGFGTMRDTTSETQYSKTQKDLWRHYTVVYSGNLTAFTWSKVQTLGCDAPALAAHTACLINQNTEMLVVGGMRSKPGIVHTFCFHSRKWRQIDCPGLPSLYHHSMTRIGNTNRILLFGGYETHGLPLNNIYVVNLDDWVCSEVNVQGQVPTPRGYHQAMLLGKQLYFTGGMGLSGDFQPDMAILQAPFDSSGFESILGADMLRALDDEDSSDVSFLIEGRQLFCHKILLSCRSVEMRNLFAHDNPRDETKRVIEIADGPSYAVFYAMIRYLYCDRITVTLENANALIDLATEYGLDQLRAIALSCTGDDNIIPPSRLNSDLGWALGNPLLSDVVVSCEGFDIPCHKIVLMQRSEYFEAMLSTGFREQVEGRVVIPEEGALVDQVLKFIYTDMVDANPQTAFDLFCEAAIFRIANLVDRCEQVLIDAIDEDTVCVLYEAADRYSSPTLRDMCFSFIQRRFWKLNELGAFENLSLHLVQDLRNFRMELKLPLGTLEQLADHSNVENDGRYIDLEGVVCKSCDMPFVFKRADWKDTSSTPKSKLETLCKGSESYSVKIIASIQLGHLSSVTVNGHEYFVKRNYATKRDAEQNAALYALHKLNCNC